MSKQRAPDNSHLEGLEEGAGCAEIWEHLSERREESTSCGAAADD